MDDQQQVANDVYNRYGLKWADFPRATVPSEHSDEAELFCARQSLAVYGVYPNPPHSQASDYIPLRNADLVESGIFRVERMIEGGADLGGASFEARQGYRTVVSDQAGALMTWQENRLIIAFRGTANWQDWIHDLTGSTIAWTADTPFSEFEVELHQGFHGLAMNLYPAVMQLIDEFAAARGGYDRIELTLCGHSLGGALALNFGLLWRELGHGWHDLYVPGVHIPDRDVVLAATYSFGAPRIGKAGIQRAIVRPHYRLVVLGDPVPRTPPGFTDDFQATYLEKPAKPAVQPKRPVGKILKAARVFIPSIGPDFAAHDMEGYIEAIENKIAAKP